MAALTWVQALRARGYTVEALTLYQYRVGGVLDLYPKRKRYHYIPLNRRGTFDSVDAIVQRYCRTPTVGGPAVT